MAPPPPECLDATAEGQPDLGDATEYKLAMMAPVPGQQLYLMADILSRQAL